MAEFTTEDIDALTRHLGSCATGLTKKEWDLLLAIFAVAAGHVDSGEDNTSKQWSVRRTSGAVKEVEDPRKSTADDLCEQLRQARVPGKQDAPIIFLIKPPWPYSPPST